MKHGGKEEAEVAHFDEPFGQHMLQEAVDEFFSGERAQFRLNRGPKAVRSPLDD